MTGEEIKERTKLKNNKVQRCQSRINQYQQNHTFKNNQGKFCRKLSSGRRNYETIEISDKKGTGISGEYLGRKKRTPERCRMT